MHTTNAVGPSEQAGVTPRATRFRDLPGPVWLLGWVSFFTDTGSEAIYPLLPLFLTRTLGASAFSLGLIEGVADAASSILKVVSGRLSDRWRVRRPLVIAGYTLSGTVRPLMAAVTAWPHVLVLRFVDRLGKGTRGAPRDAMLVRYAPVHSRGRVFGLQRAMDHAGAVAGPLLASGFLFVYPEEYRLLFALTAIPGLLAVALLLRVPEARGDIKLDSAEPVHEPSGTWRRLPPRFSLYLGIIMLFTLGNSTDAFLLLKLANAGIGAHWIPILWAGLHVVKVLSSLAGGVLADRWSRRAAIVSGWAVYAVVYGVFAVETSLTTVIAWFLIYGVYFGLTEGPERTLVADLAPGDLRATAFGIYGATTGIGTLAASLLFGILWQTAGSDVAFGVGAALAAAAGVCLAFAPLEAPRDA